MLRTCSRMAVLRDGKKVGELSGDEHQLARAEKVACAALRIAAVGIKQRIEPVDERRGLGRKVGFHIVECR